MQAVTGLSQTSTYLPHCPKNLLAPPIRRRVPENIQPKKRSQRRPCPSPSQPTRTRNLVTAQILSLPLRAAQPCGKKTMQSRQRACSDRTTHRCRSSPRIRRHLVSPISDGTRHGRTQVGAIRTSAVDRVEASMLAAPVLGASDGSRKPVPPLPGDEEIFLAQVKIVMRKTSTACFFVVSSKSSNVNSCKHYFCLVFESLIRTLDPLWRDQCC